MRRPKAAPATRREVLRWGTVAGVAGVLGQERLVGAADRRNGSAMPSDWKSVFDFGAAGDATTDNTAAFQRALDAAHKSGGGTVYAAPGKYLFRGALAIPEGVTLRGSYGCVPSHTGLRDPGQPKPGDDGTAFFVVGGRGTEGGRPFLSLNTNSSLVGLTIYYPDQEIDAVPAAYPWTIAMRGKNPAVLDVELLNPYQGIDASHNERHNIRNVTGQPLRCGIWVDAILDIGRIENVHFNPWWSVKTKLFQWQWDNGEAFIFGRSDWEYVFNTFCYAYKTGYKFVETSDGACNGNFMGIGADNCNRAILVEQCAPFALLIVNGEFTSFHGDDPTMVEVLATNSGVVRISNSAFWGPCTQIAKVAGTGTVSFSECTFVEWAEQFVGSEKEYAKDTAPVAAIQATGGSIVVHGCEFRQNKPHVFLGEAVERAVISGNLLSGPIQIRNSSKGDVQIGLNASSPIVPPSPYTGE